MSTKGRLRIAYGVMGYGRGHATRATAYRGRIDNLEFRPPGNAEFIRDLAACRAVLSTAGNQLIGEAIHFRKPVLALPEAAFDRLSPARNRPV